MTPGRPINSARAVADAQHLVARGMSIEDASHEVGISPRTYHRHVAKTRQPTFTAIEIRVAIETIFEHATQPKSQIDSFSHKLLSLLQVNKNQNSGAQK